jgi:shikimate kinase
MSMRSSDESLTRVLSHVLWLGGSVCAGKSSIARTLGAKYGLQVYHYDRHEQEHIARRSYSLSISMTMDDLWLERSSDIMAVQTIASWTGRFRFVLEDLLSLPRHPPIVAEGAGLFPEIVQPLLSTPRQAIWLVASPAFLPAMRHKRGMTLPGLTSNPEQAAQNIIARDLLMADHIRRRAAELGLTVIEVEGTKSIDEVTTMVESHVRL